MHSNTPYITVTITYGQYITHPATLNLHILMGNIFKNRIYLCNVKYGLSLFVIFITYFVRVGGLYKIKPNMLMYNINIFRYIINTIILHNI
jgi:hypothetical protein